MHRSAAYLAVKYLNRWRLPDRDLPKILNYMADFGFDEAIKWGYGSVDIEAFLFDFKDTEWGGARFLNDELDLTDDDVGAIGRGTAETVIPDGGTYTLRPLKWFEVVWPSMGGELSFTLQVGANAGETISFKITEVSTAALDLLGIDVVNRPDDAMTRLLVAIDTVSSVRAHLGAVHNRVEHAFNYNGVASENYLAGYSRIVDLDMAREVSNLTRHQILLESSSAMMAQANTSRQHVLQLLNGLAPAVGGY